MRLGRVNMTESISGYDNGSEDGFETIIIGHKESGVIYVDAVWQDEYFASDFQPHECAVCNPRGATDPRRRCKDHHADVGGGSVVDKKVGTE